MIRALQLKSGAKIQVAKSMIPDTTQRNVFVEGSIERYDLAKQLIDSIIEEQFKILTPVKPVFNNPIAECEMTCADKSTASSTDASTIESS